MTVHLLHLYGEYNIYLKFTCFIFKIINKIMKRPPQTNNINDLVINDFDSLDT